MTALAVRPRSSSNRSSASTATFSEAVAPFDPRGAAFDIFGCRAPEVLLSGPAGTGKSRACLEKVHQCLQKYNGARALVVRKTLSSLTGSGLVTYRKAVRHEGDGVTFFGGNKEEPAQYRYNTGSVLVVGGLDKASKVMSTEYDLIYVQEATELTITDWEALTTRLRNGVMPYQQLLADCNPDAPTHWLKARCDGGTTTLLESRHEDNPILHDGADWTPRGRSYIAALDALTGVRKERLRHGRWVAAEGVVYETFDHGLHVIPRASVPAGTLQHYVAGVDWGYTNPGAILVFGIDYDGRLYCVAEVYQSRKTFEWWIQTAYRLRAQYPIEVFACDPAEPAFIQQFIAADLPALGAFNGIAPGLRAVEQRLSRAGDGRPRLLFCADMLEQRDPEMAQAMKPTSTLQEFDVYRWPQGVDGKPIKEVPLDMDNHGLAALRYTVCTVDGVTDEEPEVQSVHALIDMLGIEDTYGVDTRY